MKSYNHLWEQFISEENIREAIIASSRQKRKYRVVAKIYNSPDKYIDKIRNYAEHFYNCEHTPKVIYDGISRKQREIIAPKYKEEIIHHMAIQVLAPIFTKSMYEHSYASLPNKGGYMGMKRIKSWLKHDKKNTKYCMKLDIRKYFDSISAPILKQKLAKIIHDEKFLNLLFTILNATKSGIPLGFYTSQWFANFYLTTLDHYIKEDLGATYYIRYMDDMVIFGSNKRKLQEMRNKIEQYLEAELDLHLKDNWQIFRFVYSKGGKEYGRFLDFMGYRFYRNRITLRRSIMLRMCRKAKRISKKDKATIYDIRQMMAALGWIGSTDTYRMYTERIKPYVSFRKFKQRISKYDKRIAKEMKKNELDNDTGLCTGQAKTA